MSARFREGQNSLRILEGPICLTRREFRSCFFGQDLRNSQQWARVWNSHFEALGIIHRPGELRAAERIFMMWSGCWR